MRTKTVFKLITWFIIILCIFNFVACSGNENNQQSVYVIQEQSEPFMCETLSGNLYMYANVEYPKLEQFSTITMKYKNFSSTELASLLIESYIEESDVTIIDENIYSINTSDNKYIYNTKERITYVNNMNNSINLLYDMVSNIDEESREQFVKELSFMSSDEAMQIGMDILLEMEIMGMPVCKDILAFNFVQTNNSNEDALITQYCEGTISDEDIEKLHNIGIKEDIYYATYLFYVNDVEIYNTKNSPTVKTSAETWLAPKPMEAEVIINNEGVQFFAFSSACEYENESDYGNIISLESALLALKEKYDLVILTDKMIISRIWLEYVLIVDPYDSSNDPEIFLTPYWCFQIDVESVDSTTGETEITIGAIAERFNAFNGKDLAYGG